MKLKELIDETLLLISELGVILSRLPVSFWMIVLAILLIMLVIGAVKGLIFYRQNKDKDIYDWISFFQSKWHINMYHLSRLIAPSLKHQFKEKNKCVQPESVLVKEVI